MFCPENRRIISVKIGFFFQEITFIHVTEIPGSNSFLLPTFLTGGQWDFQVANMLLATVNFEPCYSDFGEKRRKIGLGYHFATVTYFK